MGLVRPWTDYFFGLLLENKIESVVGYDVVTPTTNVHDRGCLDLVVHVQFAHGRDAHLIEYTKRSM